MFLYHGGEQIELVISPNSSVYECKDEARKNYGSSDFKNKCHTNLRNVAMMGAARSEPVMMQASRIMMSSVKMDTFSTMMAE